MAGKLLRNCLIGLAVLTLIAFAGPRAFLAWALRTQSHRAGETNFDALALAPLTRLLHGPLPSGLQVTDYLTMPNLNDGAELWIMRAEDPQVLSALLGRLDLVPAAALNELPAFDRETSRLPESVPLPDARMTMRYRDSGRACGVRTAAPSCNPANYLWTADHRVLYLYRLTR